MCPVALLATTVDPLMMAVVNGTEDPHDADSRDIEQQGALSFREPCIQRQPPDRQTASHRGTLHAPRR